MTFTDTHCHIHEASYAGGEAAYERARAAGVTRMIVVGTDEKSSREAVEFAVAHENVWASIGLHPHDASRGLGAIDDLRDLLRVGNLSTQLGTNADIRHSIFEEKSSDMHHAKFEHRNSNIVAVGEIGLDYFYNNSPRDQQVEMLHAQIELAQGHDLPIIFHVRDAFADFWPIFDQYQGLRGVVHSFMDNMSNMEKALSRDLYIGVNGIATFASDKQDLYRAVPLTAIVLETDAPYLTPHPHRGTVNEPALVKAVAQYMANLQSINLQELSLATESSVTRLFTLK